MENEELKECYKGDKKGVLKIFLFFMILLAAALVVFVGVVTVYKLKESKFIGHDSKETRTITVSGIGEVYAKPDLAIVDLSVVSEAKTVSEAMSDNTAKMNAVIDFVKSQGVGDKDIKTVNFSIYPRYDYTEATQIYPSGKRTLSGYDITQTLEVKIRDMGKIGQIIGGAAEKGANEMSGLSFAIDKEEDLKAKVRLDAIAKAKAKAKELSLQLGVDLKKITGFSENGVYPVWDNLKYAESGMGGGEAVPSVQTGENKISVTVNITYEID